MEQEFLTEPEITDNPITPAPQHITDISLASLSPIQPITDNSVTPPPQSQPITDITSAPPSKSQSISIKYTGENQVAFDATHSRVPQKKFTWRSAAKRLRQRCQCTQSCAVTAVRRHLPVVDLITTYRLREYILGDIVAGISVAILQVPQGMGYTLLASLPPIIGLYTSFFPIFIYFIFGRSNHVSMGTMALTSLIIATAIDKTIPGFIKENNLEAWSHEVRGVNDSRNASDFLSDLNNPITHEKISVAMSISFMSGIFLVMMSFAKLGFLATYISDAFMSGYISGCNVQVLTHQFKHMLGISVGHYSGPLSFFYIVKDLFLQIKNTNIATLITSLIATAILILVKKLINERFAKKLKVPVPIDIIVVIVATIISHFCHFEDKFGVKIVDNIPQGLPEPTVPSPKYMREFILDAFILGLVNYVLLFMMVKMFSEKYNQPYDANQEMFATGLCGVFGAFFSSMAASTSPPRCILGDQAGGRTQFVQLISALIVLLTLLLLAPLLEPLPICILASLIVASCIPLFRYYAMSLYYWKTSKHDLAVWVVSFVASLLIGVDIGILIGVGFSMVVVVLRTQRPYSTILKPSSMDTLLLDTRKYNTKFSETNGVCIFRFESPLYFATVDIFKEELFQVAGNPADLRANPRSEVIEPMKQNGKDVETICDINDVETLSESYTKNKDIDESDILLNVAMDHPVVNNISSDNSPLQVIILDCSTIPFLDTTGAKLLGQLHAQYESADVLFAIAQVSETARRTLERVTDCDALVAQHTYATLYNAVLGTSHSSTPPQINSEV